MNTPLSGEKWMERKDYSMVAPTMRYILRYASEMTLKSERVRRSFSRQLLLNIRAAFKSNQMTATITPSWDRILVDTDNPGTLPVLARVFGISSISVADLVCPPQLSEMCRVAVERYAEVLPGKSFAVRVRRHQEVSGFQSIEAERQIGAALFPYARKVQLKDPDIKISVEARPEGAFFFTQKLAGPGGLAVGVQGRAICLVSGGFDSMVAAWYMLKRGVAVDFVCCNMGGLAQRQQVLKVLKRFNDLWCTGVKSRLFIVDFEDVVGNLRKKNSDHFLQVILKRVMYATAAKLGQQTGALAIVTGEAIGQVSSQTLANLAAMEQLGGELPVFRPLIAFDKEEIIALSRRIGMYDLSSAVTERCSIVKGKPATSATVMQLQEEESLFDHVVVDAALAAVEDIKLDDFDEEIRPAATLVIHEIPENAAVLDIRPAEIFRQGAVSGSRNCSVDEIIAEIPSMTKDRPYVVVCALGSESLWLAEKMRKHGIEAYSLVSI